MFVCLLSFYVKCNISYSSLWLYNFYRLCPQIRNLLIILDRTACQLNNIHISLVRFLVTIGATCTNLLFKSKLICLALKYLKALNKFAALSKLNTLWTLFNLMNFKTIWIEFGESGLKCNSFCNYQNPHRLLISLTFELHLREIVVRYSIPSTRTMLRREAKLNNL